MIYASINGNDFLFDTFEELRAATFSPASRPDFVTDFKVYGADYKSRKQSARELAQNIQVHQCGGLTWGEYNAICWKLETIGKRYGLIKEYRQEGVI